MCSACVEKELFQWGIHGDSWGSLGGGSAGTFPTECFAGFSSHLGSRPLRWPTKIFLKDPNESSLACTKKKHLQACTSDQNLDQDESSKMTVTSQI